MRRTAALASTTQGATMPNEVPAHISARRQLIDRLRATADELEAQLEAEHGADLQVELQAQRIRAWMRQINRGGKLLVVLAALWIVRKPLTASAIAAAGIVIWGIAATPWAGEQPSARPPDRPPPATTSPTPTAPPTATPPDGPPEPTPEPEPTPTPQPSPEAAMPEPTTPPTPRGTPGQEPPVPPEDRPPNTRPPEEPPGQQPDPPPVRDCLLSVNAELGPVGEVDVCLDVPFR